MLNNFTAFKIKKGLGETDMLRIAGHRVTGNVSMIKFKDADTGQFIFYTPTFDLTGYGETEEKALEMVKFSLNEYFIYLMNLSNKKRDNELITHGWKHEKLRLKEFSKAIVDIDGQLQNFNAVDGHVERLTLEAA